MRSGAVMWPLWGACLLSLDATVADAEKEKSVAFALKLLSKQGEVLIDKGGNGASSTEPLRASSALAVRDELSTAQGSVELGTEAGARLRLRERGLFALLGGGGVYLAHGALEVTSPNAAATATVATPCGRIVTKSRSTLIRSDAQGTIVSVYDGSATIQPTGGAAATVQAGQALRCLKGQRLPGPQPIAASPTWQSEELVAWTGAPGVQPAVPALFTLKWQGPSVVSSYRLELARLRDEREVPLFGVDVPTGDARATAALDLRNWSAGQYVVRVAARDGQGGQGGFSTPLMLSLLRMWGLGSDGVVRTQQGVMPKIEVPRGMTFSVQIDGDVPTRDSLTAGQHKLLVEVAGKQRQFPLLVSKDPSAAPPPPQDFQGDSTSVWVGPQLPSQ